MNELGQTIIENYNTFAPKNMFSEWLKNLLQPLATLSLGFFVYKYTDNRHKKRLLNELDSKSEWRKTLFIIGGNSTVTLDDVYQIRTALRFNFKNNGNYIDKEKSKKEGFSYFFDNMNIIIIKYCINLIEKKQAVSNSIDLDIKDQNSIRLFCRYMLADHWEKNQNKNLKFDDPNKEEELCIFTLKEFLKLHKYYQNSKDEDSKNKFKSLFDESKELVEKKDTPS